MLKRSPKRGRHRADHPRCLRGASLTVPTRSSWSCPPRQWLSRRPVSIDKCRRLSWCGPTGWGTNRSAVVFPERIALHCSSVGALRNATELFTRWTFVYADAAITRVGKPLRQNENLVTQRNGRPWAGNRRNPLRRGTERGPCIKPPPVRPGSRSHRSGRLPFRQALTAIRRRC